MELTLDQVCQITLIAQRAGLSQAEIEGILQALLVLIAQPDGASKLEMAVQMLPAYQRQAAHEFIAVMMQRQAERRQQRASATQTLAGALLTGLGLGMMATALLTEYQREVLVQFGMQPEDEMALAEEILRHRAAVWQDAVAEAAGQLGARAWANPPTGVDLDDLWRMSVEDAASIVRTYNSDLEREIRRLHDANPAGNLNYYMGNLEAWHQQRMAWKQAQIALMNHKTARYHAQQRFVEMNRVRTDYRFSGPPPVCDDCANYFAMGVVSQRVVLEHPAPIHPNCPHEWRMINPRSAASLNELWRG